MAWAFRKILLLCVLVLLAGCGGELGAEKDYRKTSWETVLKDAKGSTVRFYMYGGMAHVNKWIDAYVAPQLKSEFDIVLIRVPMDASAFVQKLRMEKMAGKERGSIDLMWVNGENFKRAKQEQLLYGPYANILPNMKKWVDASLVETDFGYPVENYEAPFGKAQFVFEYDSRLISDPPETFAQLLEWVKKHPGKFTYPQPPDFTGSAFIRQAFYALTGGHEQYMKEFDQALFDANAPKLWAYLKEIEPYLWQEGRSYPKDPALLTTLFIRNKVSLMMAYHPLHAQSKVLEGAYPETVRTYVMRDGSIYNTHFTAIPANASNKAGALVVSNFLLSPEAQLSKFSPKNWGDYPVLSLSKLRAVDAEAFFAMELGAATLSSSKLEKFAVPEIPSEWLEALEKGWEENILKK